jgi:hypothetical protein
VEDFLKTIPNFRFTILRPAIVYGLGDRAGIGNIVLTLCFLCLLFPLFVSYKLHFFSTKIGYWWYIPSFGREYEVVVG